MRRKPFLVGGIVVLLALVRLGLYMTRDNSRDYSAELNNLQKTLAENPVGQRVTSTEMKCSMELPGGMTSTVSLDPELPFQYQDEEKIRYLIGTCEPIADVKEAIAYTDFYDKNKSIKEIYLDYTTSLLKDGKTELSDIKEIEPIVADGKEGLLFQADASNTEAILPLTYWVACFETEETVYKFIFWTMKSRKEKERATALNIFKSIRFNEK